MAMMWLDLARYADTHGYHIDSHRDMYHWRDWVIRAFNNNMPFDQFTVEQLAGDLLAKPTRDQLIATGFHRNHMINFEGGAIPEEYHVEYVADRVETTSTVWMGMTTGCARCHDHKYDPIKQREFYEMFAFFNQVSEKGLDGRRGNAEPVLKLTTPLERAMLDEITGVLAAREKALADQIVAPLEKDWESKEQWPAPPADGLALHLPFENSLGGKAYPARGEITYADGPAARAAVMSGESQMNIDAGAAFDGGPFTAAIWLRSGSTREVGLLQKVDSPDRRRGVEIILGESYHIGDLVRGAHVKVRLTNEWPSNVIEVHAKKPMPVSAKEYGSSWRHVAVGYDGSGKASGVWLFVDGARQELEVIKDTLAGPIKNAAPLSIGDKALGATPYKGAIDDLRIYSRRLGSSEVWQLAAAEPIRATIELVPPGKRSKEQKDRQREYFLTYSAPEDLRKAYSDFVAVRAQRDRLMKSVPDTMIMDELEKPRETYVLGRGDYRNKTVRVQPGVPSMLPPLGPELPRNRLGLARWLVSPGHPLTARVTVNRFWQMHFGTGLVKTAEDFGSQGDAPSHPELLDWLAAEFIQCGWDVRALNRLIVTSATYRQGSRTTPELVEKDPENRLLAHGPRFRLPAEMVRDSALAAAGLLNREIGGPSVYPYQPPGVWEEISYGDVYSAQTYEQSKGADLYRRSMYSFWKRTAPPPAMAAFDAPDREKCIARRARTNTPLQALVVMNDPTFIEASRVLAEKTLAAATPAARIHAMTLRVLARPATAAEITALSNLATRQMAHYRRNRKEAAALLAVGASKPATKVPAFELAAWTTVASAIFNLDEALTKE
jgi:hypothetical protein